MTTDDHGTPEPGQRWTRVLLATVVLVVLVVVIATATDRGDQVSAPGTTAVPLPATSTTGPTSTSPPATTTTLGVRNVSRAEIPGVTGTLHVLVGDPGNQLMEIPLEVGPVLPPPTSESVGFATGLGFDSSGTLLGFLDGGEDGVGSDRLNVWSETSRFGFGDIPVDSYQWHEERSRSLALITLDAIGHAVLRTFEFDEDSLVVGIDTVTDVETGESLVAWGDYGFLVTHYDPQVEADVTTLLDREGNALWSRNEITVLDASADAILAQFGNGRHYVLESADPDQARLLAGLPTEGTVTGSDFSFDGRLAVHHHLEGRNWNLRVYDIGLDTFTDFVLEGLRVWDLEWSADGRFVVMPGTDDAGGHVVIFYDTSTGEMFLFYFTDWVHWVEMN